jgi:hypothetical protein
MEDPSQSVCGGLGRGTGECGQSSLCSVYRHSAGVDPDVDVQRGLKIGTPKRRHEQRPLAHSRDSVRYEAQLPFDIQHLRREVGQPLLDELRHSTVLR